LERLFCHRRMGSGSIFGCGFSGHG
jgi:hypothetical protein